MADTGSMIIASLSKIWHLVPIVITIILFKKYMNNKDKKRLISKNEENEKQGLTLILRTIKKYEELGYRVDILNNDEKNENIDLVCYKEDKVCLVKCKDNSKSNSITDEDIKIFHKNAINYVKTNKLEKNDLSFRYVVLYDDVFDKSAIRILRDDYYNCKHVIL